MEASLKTSRNQVSRNIKRLADRGEENVLVYGCGRFVDEVKAKAGIGGNWAWFEPNVEYLSTLPSGQFDHVVLDNVLNVIEDTQMMQKVLQDALAKVEVGGSLWVNIYEGNRSGIGEFTNGRCQRNEKIIEYGFVMELSGAFRVRKILGGYRLRV